MLKKPIWSDIETTMFNYSGDMYSWSSLILISHFMFQKAYKLNKLACYRLMIFRRIILLAILPK